jgi:FkbM family methyltransferase
MASNSLPFAEAEIRLLRRLKECGYVPKVIYDVGASNGMWSNLIDQLYEGAGEYHLFEPLASSNPAYKQGLDWHLSQHPNFKLHPIGLGEQNSQQEMVVYEGGFGSTFLEVDRIKKFKDYFTGATKIESISSFPVRRLDDYAAEAKLPAPNLVKMDVQGFEQAIIAGGAKTLRTADIMILETWFYRGYGDSTPLLHEIIDTMTQLDFILTDLGDIFYGAKHKLTAIDAIFMREPFVDSIESRTEGCQWGIWN